MSLSPLQLEIEKALKELSQKTTFTEFILAKKVRENAKITEKNKAGIAISDLEAAVDAVAENENIFYSLHLNSVNTILITKSEEMVLISQDAKHRRLSSEKSMSILTNGDLNKNNKGAQKQKSRHRSERKNIRITDDFENWED